ncbi:hypothetical protein Aph01nite_33080 [Acrocarpospora phusangensis]|uniref:DUF1707 domain-containing protein n=1 Tax=Acrocarpospora phusangensis TaxID=1070424 RepID=A0A919QAD9_9ACTN|nr:DUF1707 domain-containing protein [Acrocarpospora phusangensis]GIH24998.1 hypothetical protein Aph01nite_33080 [Acrocarpospora phusangensis]
MTERSSSEIHGDLRASDADREAVSERLRVAAGEGRITLDELDERLEAVYAARTYAELDALILDLPRGRPLLPDAEALVLETRSGTIRQVGRWVVPERITAKVTMGTITIDFTEAVCHHREVRLEGTCGSGKIILIVPRGWVAVVDGMVTGMGHVINKASGATDTDVLTTLRLSGKVGMGRIQVKYPGR